VAPSDLSSTTLQQVVTNGTVTPVGLLENFTLSGSMLTAYSPYAAVYAAPDSGNLTQLWGLPLADTNDANVPTPMQIGTLSPSTGSVSVCSSLHGGYANVLSPTTAFFILQYAPSGGSCSSPITGLINWTDPSGTAPAPIPSGQSYADLYLYPRGYLYAEVALTGFNGSLNIYPASTTNGAPSFSSPTTVATGVSSADHHAITVNRSGQASSTVLFSNVLAGSTYTLYRIDTLGNIKAVYTPTVATGTTHALQLTPTVVDNTYIYFVDITYTTQTDGNPGPPITYNFFEEPLDGSSGPAQIGTAVEPQVGTTGTIFPYGITFALVDSDGTNLILEATNLTTSPFTYGLYTLPVTGGPTNQSPSLLLPYNGNSLVAFLDYPGDNLFVNEVSEGTTTSPSTTTSLVLKPSGPTVLGPSSSTSFMAWVPTTVGGLGNNTVLQFQNLPAGGGESGATLFNMNADTLTPPTQFTLNGTASFFTVSSQSTVILSPVSNTIGIGYSLGPSSNVGLALDITKNQINTISASEPDTNVSPF